MPNKQYKDPDPLAMAELDPEQIDMAAEAKKAAKGRPPSDHQLQKEQRLADKEARLAKLHNAAAAPAEDAPLTAEEKTRMLDKLTAYKERFPHLKTRNKTLKTADDIADELHYVELQLGSQRGGLPTTIFFGLMSGLEYSTQIYNPLKLNLAGLGEVTKSNMAEFEPILDELAIKYNAGTYMAPEYRLAIAVGAMVLTVHTANNGDPTLAAAMSKMNASVSKPSASSDL